MSHQVMLSDEAYQTIATLAAERGQTPEEFIESWAVVVHQHEPHSEAQHQTFEAFFTDLGMTTTDIQRAKDNANL